jgi:hypothetical protein
MRAFMESGPPVQEHRFAPGREACGRCGKLIDAGDRDGLSTRVMQCLVALGAPASEAFR